MGKTVELCGACEIQMKESFTLKRVGGGVNNKVTCSKCGKRRYGATYEIEKKSKSKA